MNKDDLTKKVLQTIKNENIKPKPRWEFLLKDYIIWTLFVVAVFVGSLSVSVIIFMLKNDIAYNATMRNPFLSVATNLPYFWLLVLLLFVILAYINLKHTKSGYRYNTLKVFVLSILFSLIFGSILYFIGISDKIEQATYKKFPIYKHMMDYRAGRMIAPNQGHLGGIVMSIQSDYIELESFNRSIWRINISNIEEQYLEGIRPGMRIAIMGELVGENIFEAEHIMPWLRPKDMKLSPNQFNYLDERNNPQMRIIR